MPYLPDLGVIRRLHKHFGPQGLSTMLAAGNSREMGRRVNVCPDALLDDDDGLLTFTLLNDDSLTGEVEGIWG